MRANLSKVAVVGGLLILAAGCGGGGGSGETGGTGGEVATGSGGHGGTGSGGNASGTGGHASGGGAGATGVAGGAGGGAGAGVAGRSGTGGAAGGSAAGASGSGGAAGGSAAGASGTGGVAGNAGATGGAAGGAAAGASGSAGSTGAAGATGSAGSGAAGAPGTGGAAGAPGTGAAGAPGTGGAAGGAAAGANGRGGAAGGGAGAGGAAGSGATATLIQNIQDGTIATGSVVSLSDVFVTAVQVSAANNTTVYIQEPEGVTTTGRTYPQYAGVEAFVTSGQAGGLPALATISVGDCISLVGTTSEAQSASTEIVTLSALSRNADAASCGTFPTPLAVPSTLASFADLATDTNATTAGDMAGARAEIFEDVLVTFSNVLVVSATATQFRVSTNATGMQTLLIDPFLYSFTVPPLAMTYTHVAGIYTQVGIGANPATFRLQPRSAADLVH